MNIPKVIFIQIYFLTLLTYLSTAAVENSVENVKITAKTLVFFLENPCG